MARRSRRMNTDVAVAVMTPPVNGHVDKATESRPVYVDRFPFGSRTVVETLPNGEVTFYELPLTQADFLNPQLGDHLTQSDSHIKLVMSLLGRFVTFYTTSPTTAAFSDLKMLWGIPDEKDRRPIWPSYRICATKKNIAAALLCSKKERALVWSWKSCRRNIQVMIQPRLASTSGWAFLSISSSTPTLSANARLWN